MWTSPPWLYPLPYPVVGLPSCYGTFEAAAPYHVKLHWYSAPTYTSAIIEDFKDYTCHTTSTPRPGPHLSELDSCLISFLRHYGLSAILYPILCIFTMVTLLKHSHHAIYCPYLFQTSLHLIRAGWILAFKYTLLRMPCSPLYFFFF